MELPHHLQPLFARLAQSKFRSKFRLNAADAAYLRARGVDAVSAQAREMLRARVGAAQPRNDGKQTPYRGHPVFVAQHATATCCRGCIEKWHGIARGRELSEEDVAQLAEVIEVWLRTHFPNPVKLQLDIFSE